MCVWGGGGGERLVIVNQALKSEESRPGLDSNSRPINHESGKQNLNHVF